MEKQNKNLLLTFIELTTEQGLLQNDIKVQKDKVFNLLFKIENNLSGDKRLFIELEKAIIDVIELTQHKYYEYGKIAHTIEEEYDLNYDPLDRIAG